MNTAPAPYGPGKAGSPSKPKSITARALLRATLGWSLILTSSLPTDAQPVNSGPAANPPPPFHMFDLGAAQPTLPWTMTECENNGHCGAWLFDGTDGEMAALPNARGHLHVLEYDRSHVKITRYDEFGYSAGLSAIYDGTLIGDHITGTVVWDWPGHFHGGGPWSADIEHVTAAEALNRARAASDQGNSIQAHRWLYEAAKQGDPRAQRLLADSEAPAQSSQPKSFITPGLVLGAVIALGAIAAIISSSSSNPSSDTDLRDSDSRRQLDAYQRRADQARRDAQDAESHRTDRNDGIGCAWGYRSTGTCQ